MSWDPLRPELRGRVPYGAAQLDVPFRLNVNENPYPPSAGLVAAIAEAAGGAAADLNRYPDRDAIGLRTDLAAYLGADSPNAQLLGPGNVWAANGSNEVMLQLLQAFGGPGRLAMGFSPTYSMYPDYCQDSFTEYVTVPRSGDFTLEPARVLEAIATHAPDVILLASPNNPTGTPASLEVIQAMADAAPGLVVVDEAYAEFRRAGTPSALELLGDHRNLVVTRTMSKAFAMAGARLGYMAAHEQIVAGIQLVRLPYHLSALTQAVGRTALAHADELLGNVASLREQRDALVIWLRAQGFEVAESDANFVFFGRFSDRDAIWSALLDRGVLVRATGPAGWLRVSAGTPPEMAAFRDALTRVVSADGTGRETVTNGTNGGQQR